MDATRVPQSAIPAHVREDLTSYARSCDLTKTLSMREEYVIACSVNSGGRSRSLVAAKPFLSKREQRTVTTITKYKLRTYSQR